MSAANVRFVPHLGYVSADEADQMIGLSQQTPPPPETSELLVLVAKLAWAMDGLNTRVKVLESLAGERRVAKAHHACTEEPS